MFKNVNFLIGMYCNFPIFSIVELRSFVGSSVSHHEA